MGRLKRMAPRIGGLAPRLGSIPNDRQAYDRERDARPYRQWYKTARWQRLRWSVLVRDLFTCQWPGCGRIVGEGWLAGPVMAASDDPTFVLNNVTPDTGKVTGAGHYEKTAGGQAWGNCTANLTQKLVGGFSMKVSFPSAAAGTYAKVGVVPTSFGVSAATGVNDLRLGVLQNDGAGIYLANDADLIAGPFDYAGGQTVQLDYNDQTGKVTLTVNGVVKVNGIAAPANLTPDMELRFSSTLYNVGAAYQLLGFDPL